MKKFERNYQGRKIKMELLTIEELNDINKIFPITQISGLCFDEKGNLLVISGKPGKWGLPGGKPEKNEAPEETLKREVKEEANVNLKKILPLAFVRVTFTNNPNKFEGDIFYQGRYLALIDSVEPLEKDPATGIKFNRKFIAPKEFPRYIRWPDASEIISLALEKLRAL